MVRLGLVVRSAGIAWAVSLGACGTPREPVEALLDGLEEAAETRDAGRIVERLAEGFEGRGGMTRVEARATLQRYFAAYESVDVAVYDVQAEGRQRVRFRAKLSGRPRAIGGLAGLLQAPAVYRFDLELASEGGSLVVSRAAWEPWTG